MLSHGQGNYGIEQHSTGGQRRHASHTLDIYQQQLELCVVDLWMNLESQVLKRHSEERVIEAKTRTTAENSNKCSFND